MSADSYKNRTFKIADPDARLRSGADLQTFVTRPGGGHALIPNGSVIKVRQVRTVATGAKTVNIFIEAELASDGSLLGWTSATNVDGKFFSETIGLLPAPAGGNRFGAHAAWSRGQYLGQIDLVRIVGTNYEIEHVALGSVNAFVALVSAARAAGRAVRLNSGFRTWAEQKHLHDGYVKGLPGFNLASKPGNSNHQNGIAFDLDVKPGEGNLNYAWLKANATQFGFIRTVKSEPWHWEYLPQQAAQARARGKFHTW